MLKVIGGERYIEQVALWRMALGELSEDVASKVAYKNAFRLWVLE